MLPIATALVAVKTSKDLCGKTPAIIKVGTTARCTENSNTAALVAFLQIEYAVNDVKFHIPLYLKMKSLLKVDYRFDCFEVFMQNQKILNLGRKFNPNFMWRLKNVDQLSNHQKHLLLLLLINRDKFAKRVNRPQHWIISDYQLVEIAAEKNINENRLAKLFSQKKQQSTYWAFLKKMILTTKFVAAI